MPINFNNKAFIDQISVKIEELKLGGDSISSIHGDVLLAIEKTVQNA